MAKMGLGRGLDALFQPSAKNVVEKTVQLETKINNNEIVFLNVNDIKTNEEQPRKVFGQEQLDELAQSIKKYGIVQPLVVTKNNDNYDLIAGERRLRAAKSIGLQNVPVVVKEYDEQTKSEISLIENIQREDLNTLEQAQAYKYIMDKYNLTQEQLASNLGKSRSSIANSLRILNLDDKIKEYIKNDELTEGHCKILVSIQNPELQNLLAQKVVIEGLSVRQLEENIKSLKEEKTNNKKIKKEKENDIWINDVEEKFKNFFQTKVQIKHNNSNRGKIIVEYYSNDELDRILDIINRG